MSASDYTTLGLYRAFRQYSSDDTSDDELITYLIPTISRAIDAYCHRWFYPITDTRVYDFYETNRLMLRDDCMSINHIYHALNEELTSQYWFLYPVNGPPYRWIEINRHFGYRFRWVYTPQRAIQIDGVWGYLENDETPSRITLACQMWMNYLITLSRNAGVRSTSIGDYSVSYTAIAESLKNGPPTEAESLLKFYKKTTLGSNVKW